MSELSRRVFLGTTGLAAGAAGLGAAAEVDQTYEGRKGPSEELPTFRFAIEHNKGHVTDGGSARQATVKELPVSKGLAGVSMRLNPGGIRELHWHAIAAEWAFVIKGRVRTTVIGPDGTSETNDFDPGDVWYFPRGHGHMLQGLGPGESPLCSDLRRRRRSRSSAPSARPTGWGTRPPKSCPRLWDFPVSAFAKFPKEELYIVQGRIPPAEIPALHQGGQKNHPQDASLSIDGSATAFDFRRRRGAAGELHRVSHLDDDDGRCPRPEARRRARAALAPQRRRVAILRHRQGADDASSVPTAGFGPKSSSRVTPATCRAAMAIISRTSATSPLRVLVGFNSGDYQEISLSTWLAANPDAVVADNFKVDDSLVAKLPKKRVFIASKDGPGV